MHSPYSTRLLLACLVAIAALGIGSATASAEQTSGAATYRPGELIVGYADGTTAVQQESIQAAADVVVAAAPPAPTTQVVEVQPGQSVAEAASELQSSGAVLYAVPNYIAHASSYIPNDPGLGGARNWRKVQWNFIGPASVNAPDAWRNLALVGKAGGKGVVVAVLDSGVAYENRGIFRRSPDFLTSQFVPGYDFVDRDSHPNDGSGHGTFVAGVVAERTNNGVSLTGLAYGAKLMAVRVLDDEGMGDAADIAAGIRWAASHGAKVINLSLEFDMGVDATQIPTVIGAINYARSRGVVIVAASGNEASQTVAYPANAIGVISVGATTEHLCQADYSNHGFGLDLVAPGGGSDASVATDPNCRPLDPPGSDVFQLTFKDSVKVFSLVPEFQGTSMSSPHVAAAAALVIASGVLGAKPSAAAVERRLKATARDLGAPGYDDRYGYGLLDAAKATAAAVKPAKPTEPAKSARSR